MQEVAEKYADQIQFVFKPHPRLFSELCKHEDWGKEKTQAYYDKWDTMENGQLQTGEFIDLFMTSDAMIHDSGSFTVEYHYSVKPVMFVTSNIEEQITNKNELGKEAILLHYIGKTKQDIIDFIENIVLKDDDPMKAKREEFKQKYLLPPNDKTVAQNMMDVLINAFC
jgi:CDP-glycerol glycerophosphotransferase (TagB/SpsB family)